MAGANHRGDADSRGETELTDAVMAASRLSMDVRVCPILLHPGIETAPVLALDRQIRSTYLHVPIPDQLVPQKDGLHLDGPSMDEAAALWAHVTTAPPSLLAFFTQRCPFSNFFPAPFHLRGQSYASSEQAYQAAKAEYAGDLWARDDILSTASAREAKRLGAKVRGDLVGWDDARFEVMAEILRAKFCQNRALLRLLQWTGRSYLVEGSPTDLVWGSGVHFEATPYPTHWKGGNAMGQLLMQLRDCL